MPFTVPDVERIPDPFSAPAPEAPGVSLWLVSTRPGEAPQIDSEMAERLRSLGYLP